MSFEKKLYEAELFGGKPISMENGIIVYPLTIEEILFELKEQNYYRYINLLTITESEIEDMLGQDNVKLDIEGDITFNFLMIYCKAGEIFRRIVEDSISYFVKDIVTISTDHQFFAIGENENHSFIDKDNYEEFKKILQLQNCMDKNDYENGKITDKAKEIEEKIKQRKKIVDELKRKDSKDSSLGLIDICSIASANCNGINVFNVYELTMYTLNDQFTRMKLMEDYSISIQQLLAGADSKKMELKHWMSKI